MLSRAIHQCLCVAEPLGICSKECHQVRFVGVQLKDLSRAESAANRTRSSNRSDTSPKPAPASKCRARTGSANDRSRPCAAHRGSAEAIRDSYRSSGHSAGADKTVGIKCPCMNLRDHVANVFDNLVAAAIWSSVILRAWPWAAKHVRRFRRRSRNTTIAPGTELLVIKAAPEPMPPGTASAIVIAMQPPPQRPLHPFGFGPDRFSPPNFVNNSNWMQ
jgi:hypothetical protein